MKKSLCVLLSLFLICTQFTAFAILTNGNFQYEDTGESITITGYFGNATDLIIPDTINGKPVTGIGDYAFSGNFESVTISDSITNIGNYAFRDNIKLTSINVSSENLYYSSESGVLFNKNKTTLIQYPKNNIRKSYTVPCTVLTIYKQSFRGSNNLESIDVGKSTQTIKQLAFNNCNNLKSVKISDSVLLIDAVAFFSCENLTTVTMGNSVLTINYCAFALCGNLSIINLPKSLTYMDTQIFPDCPLLKIYGYNNTLAQDYAIQNNIPFVDLDNTPIYIENVQLNSETNSISATIFNFSANEIISAKVGCATYDSNGKLIELKFNNLENLADKSSNTLSFQFENITNISNYKVFLWTNLISQQPLCPVKAKM